MKKQHTLKHHLVFHGIGVHSGEPSTVFLRPAPPDTGIVIQRFGDTSHRVRIGAVVPLAAPHATVLDVQGWKVSTIEHVMAAIGCMNVDNVIIELEGNEVPILDGSAFPFVQAINHTGLEEQEAQRRWLTPQEELSFQDAQGRLIKIIPPPGMKVCSQQPLHLSYSVDFEHPLIRSAKVEGSVTSEYFANYVSPARTFGFIEQLPYLRSKGLAKGTSLGNTVVIGKDDFLNEVRFPDEFIRHKALDLLGDLYLLGSPLAGTVIGHKTGHSFNRLVIEHYVHHSEKWVFIS